MVHKTDTFGYMLILSLILMACSAPPVQPQQVPEAEEVEQIVEDAPTLEPTRTLPPTETPVPPPTPTPLPTGLVFRDDFEGQLGEGWTWINEMPGKWSIAEDGWLEITSEDGSMIGQNNFQTNVLTREIPQLDQFEINTHLLADTTSDFQQAALFLLEDADNLMAINRGHCSPCQTKGDGIYTDYEYDGKWGSFHAVKIDADEVWLRLQFDRTTNYLTVFYALEADNWLQLRKIPIDLNYQLVGIGATNADNDHRFDDDLVARFDYFEIWDLQLK